jgi:nucleoside-diphosphate-sugar epimerase
MKKALVTGGCGFIGSNLTKELVKTGWMVDVVDDMSNGHLDLLEGLNTRILMNGSFYTAYNMQKLERKQDEVLVIQDDFSDDHVLGAVYQGNYDVIFHQAAVPRVSYSVEEPWHTTDVNISKTVRLFEAARNSVDRIVWASSSSVYGGADELPTKENTPKNPKSPYAWQKSAIEDFSKLCWDLYELDVVCLRYFNVFGPGQDGDGSQSRDMSYIDNTVSANILAANAPGPFKGECYNIACNSRVTNKEILDYFTSNFGSKVKHASWRPGDVMHTQADVSKAKRDFGYEPLVQFWEGLERTVKWWGLKDG